MGQFFAYATVITVRRMTMSHNVTPNTSRVELRKTAYVSSGCNDGSCLYAADDAV